MPSWSSSLRSALLSLGAAAALACPRDGVGADAAKIYTPTERIRRDRLSAVHEAVQKLQSQREELPIAQAGWNDFRCIFHAHAQDSAHTGGKLEEMLADAKRANVHAIFLGSHFRPPQDFMSSWRGLHDGVLFIPGSEVRGFLIQPMESMMAKMDAPIPEFIAAATAGQGLALLSHIEERPDHSMAGLQGLEIYNRHYDAKRDMVGLITMALKLTDPKELAEMQDLIRLYPDELLAGQVQRDDAYLEKWDEETAQGRRLTGVAANDCHHNQVFVVKMVSAEEVRVGTIVDKDNDMRLVSAKLRPGIVELNRGHQPGDTVAQLDLDPYYRSFRDSSTHLFAPELTEGQLRTAVLQGHAYVSHDWICDPTGFAVQCGGASMGDEIQWKDGLKLMARTPAPCRIQLLSHGKVVASAEGRRLEFVVPEPGVYRVEGSVNLAGEWRPWIYANPIYVR